MQASRYLEDVSQDPEAVREMALTWLGEAEDDDEGRGVQRECLELRDDGSFTHRVAHHFAFGRSQSGRNEEETSCRGRWRLFRVKFLGADVSAHGDREIGFERDTDGPPLLVQRIVVCGANPAVNGFLGAACRLYPEGRRGGGGGRPLAAPAPEPVEVTEETVQRVSEATGLPSSACVAALIESGGCAETAAVQLLERNFAGDEAAAGSAEDVGDQGRRVYHRSGGGAGACDDEACDAELERAIAQGTAERAEAVRTLREMSGRSFEDCDRALEAEGGRLDAAAAKLLELSDAVESRGGTGSSSASALPVVGNESELVGSVTEQPPPLLPAREPPVLKKRRLDEGVAGSETSEESSVPK